MRLWDFIGYVAAAFVLAAFYMREVFPSHLRETAPLRMTAMCGNLAFIVYGLTHDLIQVWLLHALLLPMNGCRLLDALRSGRLPASRRIGGADPHSSGDSGAGPISFQETGSPASARADASRRSRRPSPRGQRGVRQAIRR
jgi:hypothetical protein